MILPLWLTLALAIFALTATIVIAYYVFRRLFKLSKLISIAVIVAVIIVTGVWFSSIQLWLKNTITIWAVLLVWVIYEVDNAPYETESESEDVIRWGDAKP